MVLEENRQGLLDLAVIHVIRTSAALNDLIFEVRVDVICFLDKDWLALRSHYPTSFLMGPRWALRPAPW